MSLLSAKSENLYSTDFLNQLLSADNKSLIVQNNDDLLFLDNNNKQYQELLEKSSCSERFVFCGQAINLYTLNKIFIHYFKASSCKLVISLHPLHMAFSRQVFSVNVLYHSEQKLDARSLCLDIAKSFYIDCIKVSNVRANQPGLLVMDMDSTIIDMECIDEIAALNNVGAKVAEITELAMQGELDFNQSLISRVGCLKGIELTQLDSLRSRLPINPGFAATIRFLQERNWITCIASGGFTYFANYLKDTFNLSHAVSNTLSVENYKLSGGVEGRIINGEVKKEVLLNCLAEHDITVEQSVAIGDGANDLLMMNAAALSVAYKAKQKVQIAADANILYCGFEGLLYALNFETE